MSWFKMFAKSSVEGGRELKASQVEVDEMRDKVESAERVVEQLKQEKRVLFTKIEMLEGQERDLKKKVAELELKRKIEEEDIKHMVKMREEAMGIDKQKFELKTLQEKEQAIFAVKTEYQQKVEAQLSEQIKMIQGMYHEVLSRLPDVNVMLSNEKGGKAAK